MIPSIDLAGFPRSARQKDSPDPEYLPCVRATAQCQSARRSGDSKDPRETCPAPAPARRSRLVAAIRRTSTLTVFVPPSRSNSRSCSTRNNFTCVTGGTSPISSRKQRALVGQFELAGLAGNGAGERSLFEAEQFTFQQILRNRSAVDLQKRSRKRAAIFRESPGRSDLCRLRFRRRAARSHWSARRAPPWPALPASSDCARPRWDAQ